MRKGRMLWALAAMLVGIFVLAACKKNVGTPEDNAVSKEPEENEDIQEEDTYVFGFSGIDMENPYFITLESAVREVLEKNGYTMITKDPASSPELQITQIQEMIDEGKEIEVNCHFCSRRYGFSVEELGELMSRASH